MLRTISSPLLSALLLLGPAGLAAEPPAQEPPATASSPTPDVSAAPPPGAKSDATPRAVPPAYPVYEPPLRGRPHPRMPGATRDKRWPHIDALVPAHTGLTASASPTLFWSITAPPPDDGQLVFYLINDRSEQTVLQVALPTPTTAGIYEVALARFGIVLEEEVEYEWSVAIELGWHQTLVATGWIERVRAPRDATRSVRACAANGLWYDALERLGERITANPTDHWAIRARAELLRQVGLQRVSSL